MKSEQKKDFIKMMFDKYRSFALGRKEVAMCLGISTTTLDRMRLAGVGPRYYKQNGAAKNSAVFYSIDAVADYVTDQSNETM